MSEEREKWERCAAVMGDPFRLGVVENDYYATLSDARTPYWETRLHRSVRDRILALAERAEKAEALNGIAACSFCGLEMPKVPTLMAEHMLACEKHPVKSLMERAERAEALIREFLEASAGDEAHVPDNTDICHVCNVLFRCEALIADLDAREKAGREA